MELNELLGIGDFMLVEKSYADQKWLGRTLEYMAKLKGEDVVEAIRILDKQQELIGLAIRDKDLEFLIIFTDVIADSGKKEEFEALASMVKGAKTKEVEKAEFHEGMVEFYSLGLVNRLFCDCNLNLKEDSFYPRERIEVLKNVLGEFITENELSGNNKTLEIGCGDGGATIALHELGIYPLTVDINKCEICKGLEEEALEPKRSIILDCSLLSSFFEKEFDVVFGFMVGKLTHFEQLNWEKVLREVSNVLRSEGKVLFTVSSEEEAVIITDLLNDDFEGEIKENKGSNGYFDQWLYVGKLRVSA
ncbi:MAG: methyltransferase domain-containing protein [Methanophagales archaeon]|jgi:SAM-dependent methyltransferase|nr:methyltransferase domain-containing protein [Methanophagales archaeon]